MKTQILLAGMMLTGATAMADSAPAICENVANYSAQALGMEFADGSWGTKINPAQVGLKTDFVHYPMTATKFLGSCDGTNPNLKQSWCNVAGGTPAVYEIDVANSDGQGNSFPFATLIVTYNRGGCWVDQADRD